MLVGVVQLSLYTMLVQEFIFLCKELRQLHNWLQAKQIMQNHKEYVYTEKRNHSNQVRLMTLFMSHM